MPVVPDPFTGKHIDSETGESRPWSIVDEARQAHELAQHLEQDEDLQSYRKARHAEDVIKKAEEAKTLLVKHPNWVSDDGRETVAMGWVSDPNATATQFTEPGYEQPSDHERVAMATTSGVADPGYPHLNKERK